MTFRAGDQVRVSARHADGTVYRRWHADVVEIGLRSIVVVRRSEAPVHELTGVRTPTNIWKGFYWTDRPYNVTESYTASMEPVRLCVDVASPARLTADGIEYDDYELDVVKPLDGPAEVWDEDEFAEAVVTYGYTPEFQARCRADLEEAVALAERWIWSCYSPVEGAGLPMRRTPGIDIAGETSAKDST